MLFKAFDWQKSFLWSLCEKIVMVKWTITDLSMTNRPLENVTDNAKSGWAKTPMCCPPDCLLWGQELPGPSLWVRQRLLRFPRLPEPLQLHSGGEWGLGGVRKAQLHGLPVCPDQGGIPRVPALDGPQRPPQLLQDGPLCKSAIVCDLICRPDIWQSDLFYWMCTNSTPSRICPQLWSRGDRLCGLWAWVSWLRSCLDW